MFIWRYNIGHCPKGIKHPFKNLVSNGTEKGKCFYGETNAAKFIKQIY